MVKPVRTVYKVNSTLEFGFNLSKDCWFQVRDELEQLLDDDDDMADLYLSRKLTMASLPVGGSGAPDWIPNSPTIGSKISRASAAAATQEDNDVEELEMLLEVINVIKLSYLLFN